MKKKHLIFLGGLILAFAIFQAMSSYEFRRNVSDYTNSMFGKTSRAEEKRLRDASSQLLPALIDVGARGCVACTMMEPVLDELDGEYTRALRVEFVDIRKNPEAEDTYRIRAIPTQIFYDATGKEVARHMGYISKDQILQVFRRYGIEIKKDGAA
jgi:thioredoxin 1